MIFSNQDTCTHLLGAFRGHVYVYSLNPSNYSLEKTHKALWLKYFLLHHVTSKAVLAGHFHHAWEVINSLKWLQLRDSVSRNKTVTPNEVAIQTNQNKESKNFA